VNSLPAQVRPVNKASLSSFKINWPYWVALICLLLLIVTAVAGGAMKPHEIDDKHKITMDKRMQDGNFKISFPPLAPDARYWLGTDHRGFDMLSLILNGMKYTLGATLLIVVLRFLIAVPLGLFAGVTNKGVTFITTMNKLTSSVPSLIMIYPLLISVYAGMRLNMTMPVSHPNQKIFAAIYIACIVFPGIFPLAQQVYARAQHFNEKLFVYSSKLMGSSRTRIALRHILPNMREELVFTFLSEFVQVMFLMGQLAVLGVFIGGGETLTWDFAPDMHLTTTGEWCALIAYGIKNARIYPWTIYSIVIFYTVTIFIIQFYLVQLKRKRRRLI
jgi:peptide/nickel transport system permease protein